MGFPNKNLRQTATLWHLLGLDAFGKPSFAPPIQRRCRWQQGAEIFLDTQGEQQVASAVVYINSEEVKAGDYLVLGTTSETNPIVIRNSWPVRRIQRSPRLKGQGFFTKAML